MFPYLLAGYGAVQTGINLYKGYQNKKIADYSRSFYEQQVKENQRFYDDYYKNTGVRARYPVRSGASPNLSALYNAEWNSQRWYLGALSSGLGYGHNVTSTYFNRWYYGY